MEAHPRAYLGKNAGRTEKIADRRPFDTGVSVEQPIQKSNAAGTGPAALLHIEYISKKREAIKHPFYHTCNDGGYANCAI